MLEDIPVVLKMLLKYGSYGFVCLIKLLLIFPMPLGYEILGLLDGILWSPQMGTHPTEDGHPILIHLEETRCNLAECSFH